MSSAHERIIVAEGKLEPLPGSLKPVKRVARRVRGRGGVIHARLVLQQQEVEERRRDPDFISAYSLEKVLVEQKKKGVTILLATPVVEDSTIPHHSNYLICCGPQVVIKAVPKNISSSSSPIPMADSPYTEVAALQHLRHHHPHIIQLLDVMEDDDCVYLVFPYLPGGDLFSIVDEAGSEGLEEEEAKKYFVDMVRGLLSLKHHHLAHHDVSLENAMVGEDGHVQMIDLGMSLLVVVPPPSSSSSRGHQQQQVLLTPRSCRGKPSYLSPECVREEAFDPFKSDMWSLGVSFYTLFTGRPLYSSPEDQSFKALSKGGVKRVVTVYEAYGLKLPPGAKDLLYQMLDANPSKRPTLEDLLHHPFLRDVAHHHLTTTTTVHSGMEKDYVPHLPHHHHHHHHPHQHHYHAQSCHTETSIARNCSDHDNHHTTTTSNSNSSGMVSSRRRRSCLVR